MTAGADMDMNVESVSIPIDATVSMIEREARQFVLVRRDTLQRMADALVDVERASLVRDALLALLNGDWK